MGLVGGKIRRLNIEQLHFTSWDPLDLFQRRENIQKGPQEKLVFILVEIIL